MLLAGIGCFTPPTFFVGEEVVFTALLARLLWWFHAPNWACYSSQTSIIDAVEKAGCIRVTFHGFYRFDVDTIELEETGCIPQSF